MRRHASAPILFTCLAVTCLAGPARAASVTIDFEAAQHVDDDYKPLSIDGFTFTQNAGYHAVIEYGSPGPNNNAFVIDDIDDHVFSSVTVTYAGGAFSLDGFDLLYGAEPQGVRFTSSAGGSVVVGQTPFTGFSDITSFTFEQTKHGIYILDDFRLTVPGRLPAVPLPASAPLFGVALLAGGLFGRAMKGRSRPVG